MVAVEGGGSGNRKMGNRAQVTDYLVVAAVKGARKTVVPYRRKICFLVEVHVELFWRYHGV